MAQIREREVAVQQLETDIVDMNQMFKVGLELATIRFPYMRFTH